MKRTAARLTLILVALAAFFVFAGVSAAEDATAKVDINTASKAQLKTLTGVGNALADRIIEYREKNGPFKNPSDLKNVKGIGPSTLSKNKDRIVAGTPAAVKETPAADKPKTTTPDPKAASDSQQSKPKN